VSPLLTGDPPCAWQSARVVTIQLPPGNLQMTRATASGSSGGAAAGFGEVWAIGLTGSLMVASWDATHFGSKNVGRGPTTGRGGVGVLDRGGGSVFFGSGGRSGPGAGNSGRRFPGGPRGE